MDYKIGFEIHRTISKSKLFCKCNTNYSNYVKKHVIFMPCNLKRTLNKTHLYYYSTKSCGYEIDELPPVFNVPVINLALSIAKDFGFKLEKEYIISRKYILDGSLAAGFQKTGAIGHNAILKYYNTETILLTEIYLEEDSSTRYKKGWHTKRQGSALVEIVSEPISLDLNNLEKYKDIVLEIGHKLRNYNIPKGKGLIRQDINLDFGFGKVELKGVQDPLNIREIITKEYERTKTLSELITSNVIKKYYKNNTLIKIALIKSPYVNFIISDLLNLIKYEGNSATKSETETNIVIHFHSNSNEAYALLKMYLINLKNKDFSCTRAVKKDLNSELLRKKQLADRIHIETDLNPYKIQNVKNVKYVKTQVKSEIENKILNSLNKLGIKKNIFCTQLKNLLSLKQITRYQIDELLKEIIDAKGLIKITDLISMKKYAPIDDSDISNCIQSINSKDPSKIFNYILCNLRHKIYDFNELKEKVNKFVSNNI